MLLFPLCGFCTFVADTHQAIARPAGTDKDDVGKRNALGGNNGKSDEQPQRDDDSPADDSVAGLDHTRTDDKKPAGEKRCKKAEDNPAVDGEHNRYKDSPAYDKRAEYEPAECSIGNIAEDNRHMFLIHKELLIGS